MATLPDVMKATFLITVSVSTKQTTHASLKNQLEGHSHAAVGQAGCGLHRQKRASTKRFHSAYRGGKAICIAGDAEETVKRCYEVRRRGARCYEVRRRGATCCCG
jgi:hypothetical protein